MTTILSRISVEELRHVKNNKNVSYPVIVIEPRPRQARLLRSKLSDDDRFIILEKELDTKDGSSDFFVYDDIKDAYYKDWNLSSLHEFSDNVIDCLTFFRASEDLKNHIKHVCGNPTKTIVETSRLDTIISKYDISHIDYLDVTRSQGNQFNALSSIGEKIDIVRKGVSVGAWGYQIHQSDGNHALDIARWLANSGNDFQLHIHNDKHPINITYRRGFCRGLWAKVWFNRQEKI